MKARDLLRDAAIAFSLANLLFLRRWAELFTVATPKSYYLKVALADFQGTLLALFAVGLAILLAAQLRHTGVTGRRVVGIGLALALVVLANQIGARKKPGLLGIIVSFSSNPAVAVLQTLAATIVAMLAARFWTQFRILSTRALLLLSPFVLVTAGRAAWYAHAGELERFSDRAPAVASVAPGDPGPRVVILMFDAMGRALGFDQRPAGVAMPAFDRLRAESFDATRVRRAGEHTREAVPGMLSGLQPIDGRPTGASELTLTLPDGRKESWSSLPTLFTVARENGGAATVVGWYHPYCRLFATELDGCVWYPGSTAGGQVESSVRASFLSALRGLVPFTVYRDRHARAYVAIMGDAKRELARPGRGITWVHLPVPHYPAIWNRESQALTAFNFRPNGYEAQLELADRTLADLRSEMERAGTWSSSTVLVVSDHPSQGATKKYLMKDDEVPFLLKLPGSSAHVTYSRTFSAATVYPLVSALLRGELTESEEVERWLDANAIEPDPRAAGPGDGEEE